jgi:hypothetical protein
LLGRLDAETALLPPVAAPATLLPRVLVATSAQRTRARRRRRGAALSAVLVAACLAALAGFAVHVIDQAGVRGPSAALTAMVPVSDHEPVSAEVGLVGVRTGTRVEMKCRYTSDGEDGRWTIRLVVFPRWGGLGEQIGTWTARPGEEVSVTALTHLAPSDIGRVELHRANDTTLLVWTPT